LIAEGRHCVHRFRRYTAVLQELIERGFVEALEGQGHTLIVTADKDGPNCVFERELPDADIVTS